MTSSERGYPTMMQFLERCVQIAEDSGFSTDRGHPEDHYANVLPIMQAYSAGWSNGWGTGYRSDF